LGVINDAKWNIYTTDSDSIMQIVDPECFLCREKGYHTFRIVDKEHFLCNRHYTKYNDPTYNMRNDNL
jgi:hypothetical protein